jgi:hypothetical protein
MATAAVQQTIPLLNGTKTNGIKATHQRRDLKTVVNYADEEAYQESLKATDGKPDLNGGNVSVDQMLNSFNHNANQLIRVYTRAPSLVAQNVVVEDIGGREKEFTLDRQGFMMAKQKTKVILTSEDLTNTEKIKNEYYPEMEAWLKEV